MGQILDKFQGRNWRERQLKKITDKAFDRFANQTGRSNLTFEDVYIAVLLVYNDINKYLPGPHFDPPPKDELREMMKEFDKDSDGELNREEFSRFIKQLTADTACMVSQGLIITLLVAPTVALVTKRATEGVPGIGKMVQKLPNSVYASLVALAVVMFQRPAEIE